MPPEGMIPDPELAAAGIEDVTDNERNGAGVLAGTHDPNGNPKRALAAAPEEPEVPEVEPGQTWMDPTGEILADGVTLKVEELLPASDLRGAVWRCTTSVGAELLRAPSTFAQLQQVVSAPRVAIRDDGSFKSPAERISDVITRMEGGEAPTLDELRGLRNAVAVESAVVKAAVLLDVSHRWQKSLQAAMGMVVRQAWPEAIESLAAVEQSLPSAHAALSDLMAFCRKATTHGIAEVGGWIIGYLIKKDAPVGRDALINATCKRLRVPQDVVLEEVRRLWAADLVAIRQTGADTFDLTVTDAGRAFMAADSV